MSISVIIPAGGSGERLGAKLPKALVQLAGRTLIEHAVAQMSPIADEIIVAAPKGLERTFQELLGSEVIVVTGGITRTESVNAGLRLLSKDAKFVLVHDAARPLASTDLARRIIKELQAGADAVIPGLKVADTIKRVNVDGFVTKTPNRAKLRAIQTPQGFTRETLVTAHKLNSEATDDAALVEELDIPVKVILGEDRALKITTPDDLGRAQRFLLGAVDRELRVGIGTDAHAFSSDSSRLMSLACLQWPGEVGVDGHSDGDVAAHAICDALLSAAQCGDLGSNFGTSRPEYAGASGAKLLQETLAIVVAAGYSISNVSVQIVGNRPKIGPRRQEAIDALSAALGGASVSVSATTTDGLGFTGEGKGLSAIATALITRN
jgi:2-C-methyl-D-erythritol 4-phosphate cytidylyltransferase/2-C-methyl-D-erythritol 2,4-cyclodiphosphate synthase